MIAVALWGLAVGLTGFFAGFFWAYAQWNAQRQCTHRDAVPLYGDAIIANNWKRAACNHCGLLLDDLPEHLLDLPETESTAGD